MAEGTIRVNPTKFLFYAGTDTARWRDLIGMPITHFTFGSGTIVDVNPGPDAVHHLELSGPSDLPTKTLSSKYFVGDLIIALALPPELAQQVERRFEETDGDNNTFAAECVAAQIEQRIKKAKITEAKTLFDLVQHRLRTAQRDTLQHQLDVFVEDVRQRIDECLEAYEFAQADAHYEVIQELYPKADYQATKAKYEQRRRNEQLTRELDQTRDEIRSSIDRGDIERAKRLYKDDQRLFSNEQFNALVKIAERNLARTQLQDTLRELLEAFDFSEADLRFHQTDLLTRQEYEEMKAYYVQRYVKARFSTSLSTEQAMALSSIAPNVLVKARAGSGKTTVIGCKAAMLMDGEGVEPDQILIMAFNTDAAAEIRHRVQTKYQQTHFANACTFHSLAYRLVNPTEVVLSDDNSEQITRKLTLFVQQLLEEYLQDATFAELVYSFFREEMSEITQAGSGLSDQAFFELRRNLQHLTLRGERVKSNGEKYIADFLFEHDIPYQYEKAELWGSRVYRPDFSISIQGQRYIIEHWGINEDDPNKRTPPGWRTTWDAYFAEMQRKRDYWASKPEQLLETSIRDLQRGRRAFEATLEARLAQVGIQNRRLTEGELHRKLREGERYLTHLAELFTQFIQSAKQQRLGASDIRNKLLRYRPNDTREKVFLDLAAQVYEGYEHELADQGKINFDDFIARAISRIDTTRGNCQALLDDVTGQPVQMQRLRWILIDEYQDFSPLFDSLIRGIKKHNPGVRLFCVGDDWQAINGFAGSHTRYIRQFGQLIRDSQTSNLLTNFRSQAAIVAISNALMEGFGQPAVPLPQNDAGEVYIEYVDDIWIEMRSDPSMSDQKVDDQRFIVPNYTADGAHEGFRNIVASKYLKRCYEIITCPKHSGKSVAVLCRTNWIDGVRLDDFQKHLRAVCRFTDRAAQDSPSISITVSTVHQYKGLEADIVIILQVCEGQFPLLHPNNALSRLFGRTLMDALEEERRLFFVALTRAKQSLYILAERERASSFLYELPVSWGKDEEVNAPYAA